MMNVEIDARVARYHALDAEVDALLIQQGRAAEPDQPAIEAALSRRYDDMAQMCGAILDVLLGPGGSGRPAA